MKQNFVKNLKSKFKYRILKTASFVSETNLTIYLKHVSLPNIFYSRFDESATPPQVNINEDLPIGETVVNVKAVVGKLDESNIMVKTFPKLVKINVHFDKLNNTD